MMHGPINIRFTDMIKSGGRYRMDIKNIYTNFRLENLNEIDQGVIRRGFLPFTPAILCQRNSIKVL